MPLLGSLKSWAVVENFFSASLSVTGVAFRALAVSVRAGGRLPHPDRARVANPRREPDLLFGLHWKGCFLGFGGGSPM